MQQYLGRLFTPMPLVVGQWLHFSCLSLAQVQSPVPSLMAFPSCSRAGSSPGPVAAPGLQAAWGWGVFCGISRTRAEGTCWKCQHLPLCLRVALPGDGRAGDMKRHDHGCYKQGSTMLQAALEAVAQHPPGAARAGLALALMDLQWSLSIWGSAAFNANVQTPQPNRRWGPGNSRGAWGSCRSPLLMRPHRAQQPGKPQNPPQIW